VPPCSSVLVAGVYVTAAPLAEVTVAENVGVNRTVGDWTS
jgi:hypothetical protein